MLKLRDFFQGAENGQYQVGQLPALLLNTPPGLIVIAGPEGRPLAEIAPAQPELSILASGRKIIFNTLLEEILEIAPSFRAAYIQHSPSAPLALARGAYKRVVRIPSDNPADLGRVLSLALARKPDLLAIERLTSCNMGILLKLAAQGQRILAQIDSIFSGPELIQHILSLNQPDSMTAQEKNGAIKWLVSVQRIPLLCSHCRVAHVYSAVDIARIEHVLPFSVAGSLALQPGQSAYYTAAGCAECNFSGRRGDAPLVDIFQNTESPDAFRISLQAGLWRMLVQGQISLTDFLYFQADVMQRVFRLLQETEQTLIERNRNVQRQSSTLQAAQRVLEQRTQALFSFQDIGHILISSNDLENLASRVCRRAGELCGADFSLLYYHRNEGPVEILAASGWPGNLVHYRLPPKEVFTLPLKAEPLPYHAIPPGISVPPEQANHPPPGFYINLVAQGELVGVMILQGNKVKLPGSGGSNPGETALLQALANQAALALQRAGLVETLREKIAQLEAAQAELRRKERIEREMELARQVQQSVLPTHFPAIPGFAFAARNEPARQVGGDFYDVIALDADTFGLAIADVSDKGMPAALYMALTRSLLVAEARRDRSPRNVLIQINNLLQALGKSDMFVTVFYGVVSRTGRTLTYARAGHDRPFLLRNGGLLELNAPGMPLGIFDAEDFNLGEAVAELQPGDRVILHTDGLADTCAPSGELYGLDRLKELVLHFTSSPSPDQLCQSLFTSLAEFRAHSDQFDDMTLLIMDFNTAQV